MDAYRLPTRHPQDFIDHGLPDGWRLVDVRRRAAARASGVTVAGATWIDPLLLSPADPIFKQAAGIAFYCAKGHEIGTYATAMALVAGVEAVMIEGGFEALCAHGAPLAPLMPGPVA